MCPGKYERLHAGARRSPLLLRKLHAGLAVHPLYLRFPVVGPPKCDCPSELLGLTTQQLRVEDMLDPGDVTGLGEDQLQLAPVTLIMTIVT